MQKNKTSKEIITILKSGGVGVIPTDTIFGIIGDAKNKKTVERIYKVRKRNPQKPCIILISKITELKDFGVMVDKEVASILKRIWPDKVTVILPVSKEKQKELQYLHRGTNSLAFRLPAKKSLSTLVSKTGPLIAPSANFEGETPAQNLTEAKACFGQEVDFYLKGKTNTKASTIVKLENQKLLLLREGAVPFTRLKSKIGLK